MDVVKTQDNNRDRAFVRIVDSYQEMLLRMCYVYLRDEEQAKDAVQETFLKAYKALPSFRQECNEKTWLVKIAINTCRSMQRSAWFRHVDRRITPDQIPGVSCMELEDELGVMCEIMRLPPKLKEVIMLYYWEDMTTSEIAIALGLPQSTVTNRLKRARDKLQILLEGSGLGG